MIVKKLESKKECQQASASGSVFLLGESFKDTMKFGAT